MEVSLKVICERLLLRLHSFLSEVMEDSEETLIFPSWSFSVGLACFRKRL